MSATNALQHELDGDDQSPFSNKRGRGGGPPPGAGAPSDTYGESRDAAGNILNSEFLGPDDSGERPDLPADLKVGTPQTVDTSTGSYRVLATPDPHGRTTTVVALPLDATNQALERLLIVEGIVIIGVLTLIGGFALVVVRVGLLPLDRMGHTAAAIAGGDLSHRVEMTDQRTEVGRLGTRAEPHARPPRGRVRRARGEPGAAAPLHRRRLA